MSLELKSIKLETLTQAGVVLNSEEVTESFPLASQYNVISERKRLTFSFDNLPVEYDTPPIEGALLYINFAMFLPKGFIYSEPTGPPNTGFNLMIPETLTPTQSYTMNFYCNGNQTVKTNNNLKCTFIASSDSEHVNDEFTIILEYYNTFDEGTFFNSTDKNNQWRFMAEYFNQLNFNEIPDSVYHTEKELRAIVFFQSGEYTTKQQFALVEVEANTFNAESTWLFGDEGYTEISSSKDTEVVVLVKTEATLDDYYVKIFNDKNDTSLDFISNYNIRENKIDPASVDNLFKAPFEQATVVIDGDTYRELKFTIDKDLISPDNDYRMIGIGYDEAFLTPIIFISPLIKVQKAYPYDGNGIDFTGSISDIQREFYGDELTATIDERLKTKMYLDYAYDKYKNDIFNRLGIEVTNDIRNFLDTVTVEIYEQYVDDDLGGTVKVLLETSVLRKISVSSYEGEGITASFYDDGAQFEYTFRNRSDVGAVPVSVSLDGVPYYSPETPIGNQYWGGKDLFIKWSFSFPYAEFTDVIDYVQKLHVKDYIDGLLITRKLSEVDYTFPGDGLFYEAELTAEIPDFSTESFLLMNMIKASVLPITEEESFSGTELPAQANAFIYDQDALFWELKANFSVETSDLVEGQQYEITAIAKKNYNYSY